MVKPNRTVLEGVTGLAAPAELLAVLGPSGSGKTTLLSILAGRLPFYRGRQTSGSITYNGLPFSAADRRRARPRPPPRRRRRRGLRRESIGAELVAGPALLLLDEPTSGLDSTTAAARVVEGLRAAVAAVHQPWVFGMFDRVLVLVEGGRPIYSGRASRAVEYFGSIGFPVGFVLNPDEFLLDLANGFATQTKEEDL